MLGNVIFGGEVLDLSSQAATKPAGVETCDGTETRAAAEETLPQCGHAHSQAGDRSDPGNCHSTSHRPGLYGTKATEGGKSQ